jgi:hypothetical protein
MPASWLYTPPTFVDNVEANIPMMQRLSDCITELQNAVNPQDAVPLSSALTSSDPPPYVRLMGDGSDIVQMGNSVSGTITNGMTIATIPAGYRPARQQIQLCSGSPSTAMICRITIAAVTGIVVVTFVQGTPTSISFQNVSYPIV